MKKRTKILSIMLALMLTATLVPTALVQAFASDYYSGKSTPDEPENDDYIESFEITKAPDKTEFYYSEVKKEDFFDKLYDGLKFCFNMKDGSSIDYSYNETGDYIDFGGIDDYGYLSVDVDDIEYDSYDECYILSPGKHTVRYTFTHYATAFNTYDYTATKEINVIVPELTSIEITKAPDNTTIEKYYDGYVWADDLMEGLEMLLTFDDGTTYNYSYDEDFEVPACFYEKGIDGELKIQGTDEDGTLNNLPLGETEITYELSGCTATQKITVLENEFILNPITKLELTKLPDKEFSAPYIKEDESNSIAYNMKGAELTISRKNGEKNVITFSEGIYKGHDDDGNAFAPYVYFTDPNSKPIFINVKDLGDYKAVFRLEITDLTLEFSVKNTGTNDNPATPGEVINPSNPSSTVPASSQGGTSATSDTPANSNTSSGNTSNGAIATGNAAVSAIMLSVLLLAAGVMAVIGRKKQLF
ncbi:hypothetical protein [uncultured Ruminococcus sp.]|uniref:hypothetical protein n=1 Tax=uncultured Ruminococcus sp. TaxID=165186 RepID=UPI0025E2D25A|nr:hypothetical protein [uncultured Ruminococcus sp.]